MFFICSRHSNEAKFLIRFIEAVAHKDFVQIFYSKCLLEIWEDLLEDWKVPFCDNRGSRGILKSSRKCLFILRARAPSKCVCVCGGGVHLSPSADGIAVGFLAFTADSSFCAVNFCRVCLRVCLPLFLAFDWLIFAADGRVRGFFAAYACLYAADSLWKTWVKRQRGSTFLAIA